MPRQFSANTVKQPKNNIRKRRLFKPNLGEWQWGVGWAGSLKKSCANNVNIFFYLLKVDQDGVPTCKNKNPHFGAAFTR